MKKFKVMMLISAAILTLFCGCGSKEESSAKTPIVEKIPEGQTLNIKKTEEEPEEEEEEVAPEGKVRSDLTNEWIDEDLAAERPLAVMYPINKEAQPQYGLNKVDIFYEIMEEDKMSRQMGIIQDWKNLDRIGNIRSIRDYFVYAALEYDPIIIHFGGPEVYVKDILAREDVDNINGVGGAMGPSYDAFFRIPEGSTSEHTAFTDSQHILDACEEAGFELEHRDDYYIPDHFKFASKENTLEDAELTATELSFAEAYPTTQSSFEYNEDDQKYYRSIYGEQQCDAVTGDPLAFDNVIVQFAYYEVRDQKGYLAFQMHDKSRDGYYITRGKMIHIKWQKTADYEPTRYYDDDGNEIEMNTGKTMICVVQEDKVFTADGTDYEANT